jgi:hypothetical protein
MTLDTPADLEALRRLVDEVGPEANMDDVLKAHGLT